MTCSGPSASNAGMGSTSLAKLRCMEPTEEFAERGPQSRLGGCMLSESARALIGPCHLTTEKDISRMACSFRNMPRKVPQIGCADVFPDRSTGVKLWHGFSTAAPVMLTETACSSLGPLFLGISVGRAQLQET